MFRNLQLISTNSSVDRLLYLNPIKDNTVYGSNTTTTRTEQFICTIPYCNNGIVY